MPSINPSRSRQFRSRFPLHIGTSALLVWLLPFCGATAQNVPIITGSVGVLTERNEGVVSRQLEAAPVFAAPLGSHLLAEGRFNFDGYFLQNNRTGPYNGSLFKSTQILQLDYIANSRLTLVLGQSLVPFNVYNERLSQLWQQNFQDAPQLAAVGTRDSGTAVGMQARGNAFANDHIHVNYVGWFSKRGKPLPR